MIDQETASSVGMPSDSAVPLALHLFGPFEVRLHGQQLPRLRSRKGHWLLALLTLRHGGEVDRAWLAGTLWPDSSEPAAFASLRSCLKDLRRALGAEAGRLYSPTPRLLALDLAGTEADVVAFDAAIARGDAPALEQAIALYRGPLLAEWPEEWAFAERQARDQAYLTALETLAQAAQARGDRAAAERHLRRAAAVDPLRETAQRALMQALAAGGNYAAASEAYRELRLRLHREVNAEPAPETQALYQQLRADARNKAGVMGHSVTRQAPSPAAQVPADRPPALPHNLPQPLTRFIGRESQMAEIAQLLTEHRLLTLTGAGGCGKTRLALQVAAELGEAYPDGVWLVELAALADPALVPQAVAAALEVREEPDRSLVATLSDNLRAKSLLLLLDNCEHLLLAGAQLAEALLRSCPSLRILATSREGLGIAGERTYRVPSLSLPPAEGVGCWAGTREAGGGVGSEPPLPNTQHHHPLRGYPPNTLRQYEAVSLFIERARFSQPGFAVTPENAAAVAQVCQRLDGIPLALELAAGRLQALSVEQIAARLDDRFRLLTGGSRTALSRHQTLRALIDWSYDLLTAPEQALLRRLSVFAGGWTLEAAEAVCGAAVDSGQWIVDRSAESRSKTGQSLPAPTTIHQPLSTDVLALLAALVAKSLVQYQAGARGPEGRYRLLETVRQYSRERLLEAGEAVAVRGLHRDWYLALVLQRRDSPIS